MLTQQKLRFNDKEKNNVSKDEFAESCKPLSELLDSVRNVEGFPVGTDEDILALSDPPYYTACPNPYINDFIKKYGTPYNPEKDNYEKTPFINDIAGNKNDNIYSAHTYHTKVPPSIIEKFIDHYTNENDIVLDCYSGSGMTGIAAQNKKRNVIQIDLSPIASFISYNYSSLFIDYKDELNNAIQEIFFKLKTEYKHLYLDSNSNEINYTVWSEVYICSYCKNDILAYNNYNDDNTIKCPTCNSIINKKKIKRKLINDKIYLLPVFNNTNVPIGKDEFKQLINDEIIPYPIPQNIMNLNYKKWGNLKDGNHKGVKTISDLYFKRTKFIMGRYLELVEKLKLNKSIKNKLIFILTAASVRLTILNRYILKYKTNVGPLSGTLYIPPLIAEMNSIKNIFTKAKEILKILTHYSLENKFIVSTQSSTDLSNIKDNSIDYIFIDPPFGNNLMYSGSNFIFECWLKIFTNVKNESIVNEWQGKGLYEYGNDIYKTFCELYKKLKPNRWITVEFNNSKAEVWNLIQKSLTKAGFIIAQVSILDKKKGSIYQAHKAGSVKKDLIINAYKPKEIFKVNYLKQAGKNMEIEFVNDHLQHLPIIPNVERTEPMLYSKVLAIYIQNGFEINLDAKMFYLLLRDNFKLIDGYWFNDNQVLKYDEWKKKQGLNFIKEIKSGQTIMFISDEKTALIWLYNFLEAPQTYSDIYTAYSKATANIEDEIPELKLLLESNFILEDNKYRRPHNNKEKENVELQRENELNRAFEKILLESKTSTKKIKSVRKEAIIAGFTKAYQEKRYADILNIAKKLDNSIIENNSDISDFVDIAKLKIEGSELF